MNLAHRLVMGLRRGSILFLVSPLTAQWSVASTLSDTPPRMYHASAYDITRGEVMIHGGRTLPLWNSETWTYDGIAWTLRASGGAGPGTRIDASAVFHHTRQTVLLFGGGGGTGPDLWEWDGSVWTPRPTTSSPRVLFGTAMAYDPIGDRVLLYGGSDVGSGAPGSPLTWAYDGIDWWRIVTSTSPRGVTSAEMVFDTRRNVCVLFGGATGSFVSDETWEFDGANWERRFTQHAPPARYLHGMTYDPASGLSIVHGGSRAGAVLMDTWSYDGFDWVELAPSGPDRTSHALVYDIARDVVVCHAGVSTSGQLRDETWELSVSIPASQSSLGVGCGPNPMPPQLVLTLPFQLAGTFQVDVSGVPIAATEAFLLVGFANLPVPIDLSPAGLLGCAVQVDPVDTLRLPAINGTATWSGAVPAAVAWTGRGIFLQGVVPDPAANPLGLSFTGGMRAVVGH